MIIILCSSFTPCAVHNTCGMHTYTHTHTQTTEVARLLAAKYRWQIIKNCRHHLQVDFHTVPQDLSGERGERGYIEFCKSFLHEMLTSYQSVNIFSLETLPLYRIILLTVSRRWRWSMGWWGKPISRHIGRGQVGGSNPRRSHWDGIVPSIWNLVLGKTLVDVLFDIARGHWTTRRGHGFIR